MNELSLIDLNRAEENESNNGNISKLSVAQMPQRSSVVLSKMSSRVSLTVSNWNNVCHVSALGSFLHLFL